MSNPSLVIGGSGISPVPILAKPILVAYCDDVGAGQRVNTYDLYLFSKEKNLVVGWHRFEAPLDIDALKIADGLVIQPPAELWKSEALLKRWEAPS